LVLYQNLCVSADWLSEMMQQKLGNLFGSKTKPEQLLPEVNFDGVVKYILDGKCKNIITMAGAGISTC
jgi:NAD-dependent deacetylase sirtuin 2